MPKDCSLASSPTRYRTDRAPPVELSGFSVFGWLSLIWSLKASSFLGSNGEHTIDALSCFPLGTLKSQSVARGSGFLKF
jgi:hypothetical protein